MDRTLLTELLKSNGITDGHERAMFDIFIRMLLNYQMGLGIKTKDLKRYMEIVTTFMEMIGEDD